eukprot:515367-Pyramimonas_sp.AAC.1
MGLARSSLGFRGELGADHLQGWRRHRDRLLRGSCNMGAAVKRVSRLDAALSPRYPVQLTLDGKKAPERALWHRAPRPFPTERP